MGLMFLTEMVLPTFIVLFRLIAIKNSKFLNEQKTDPEHKKSLKYDNLASRLGVLLMVVFFISYMVIEDFTNGEKVPLSQHLIHHAPKSLDWSTILINILYYLKSALSLLLVAGVLSLIGTIDDNNEDYELSELYDTFIALSFLFFLLSIPYAIWSLYKESWDLDNLKNYEDYFVTSGAIEDWFFTLTDYNINLAIFFIPALLIAYYAIFYYWDKFSNT